MEHIKKVVDWFINEAIGYDDNYDQELEMMEEDMYMSWLDMDDYRDKEHKFNDSEISTKTH